MMQILVLVLLIAVSVKSLNIDLLQKKTYGSRKNDNLILSKLTCGVLKYEDIVRNS